MPILLGLIQFTPLHSSIYNSSMYCILYNISTVTLRIKKQCFSYVNKQRRERPTRATCDSSSLFQCRPRLLPDCRKFRSTATTYVNANLCQLRQSWFKSRSLFINASVYYLHSCYAKLTEESCWDLATVFIIRESSRVRWTTHCRWQTSRRLSSESFREDLPTRS